MIPTKEEWYRALAARHGEAFQKRAEHTTVVICGLGGLGSNISICLARAGVAMAAAVFMLVPPIVIFMLAQRQVIETMAHSGIKD